MREADGAPRCQDRNAHENNGGVPLSLRFTLPPGTTCISIGRVVHYVGCKSHYCAVHFCRGWECIWDSALLSRASVRIPGLENAALLQRSQQYWVTLTLAYLQHHLKACKYYSTEMHKNTFNTKPFTSGRSRANTIQTQEEVEQIPPKIINLNSSANFCELISGHSSTISTFYLALQIMADV